MIKLTQYNDVGTSVSYGSLRVMTPPASSSFTGNMLLILYSQTLLLFTKTLLEVNFLLGHNKPKSFKIRQKK